MVETMCTWVTLKRSTVFRNSSGSNFSISTMETPALSGWAISNARGAA